MGNSTVIPFGFRHWHGSIRGGFDAINNMVSIIVAHQPAWPIAADLLAQLCDRRDRLQNLINKCHTNRASPADREQRNTLLKSTVNLCRTQVKVWAHGAYFAGALTASDVHLLGFLLPGETGGYHARTEATDVTAEVKVKVINEDFIRVVVNQGAGESAAQVAHGWPPGVHKVLIVITAADGKTEVLRLMTTRLHNDVRMPEGSHGKQFIIKAAFLKHVDDKPVFGVEPTFSMPLTTSDLLSGIEYQRHWQVMEEQSQEIARLRREIEELRRSKNV
jgi:hypothetical protein